MSEHDKYTREIDVGLADVIVDMGEWTYVTNDQTIATEGLGPCIGVAVYDPDTHSAYLAHSFNWDLSTVREMTNYITTQAVQIDTLQAWLLGGSATAQVFDGEIVKEVRTKAEQLLTNLGIAKNNIDTIWINNPDEAGAMILDAATGECTIEISSSFNDEFTD